MGPNCQAASSIIVKRFETPDKSVVVDKGRFELMAIGGTVIVKASYAPGWKSPGQSFEHAGVVLSGRARVCVEDGWELDITPGDHFQIASEYEIRVVGYRPCEVLYFGGTEALLVR